MEKELATEEISARFARTWWKALMGNACALLEDAALLAEHGSPGRSQALLVLSMEELAKARWLYLASESEWNRPLGLHGLPPAPSGSVRCPKELAQRRFSHMQKLQAAEQFTSGLGGFWDSRRSRDYYYPADLAVFEDAAAQRNADKQAGFYVDRVRDQLLTPLAIPAAAVSTFLRQAAQSLEMHLIEDHVRQQGATIRTAIDFVHDLQWVVLPYASPQLFTGPLRDRNLRERERVLSAPPPDEAPEAGP